MDTTLVHKQAAGLDMEGRGMNDDDNDFEMFGELIMLVFAMLFFILLAAGIGALLWWLIA